MTVGGCCSRRNPNLPKQTLQLSEEDTSRPQQLPPTLLESQSLRESTLESASKPSSTITKSTTTSSTELKTTDLKIQTEAQIEEESQTKSTKTMSENNLPISKLVHNVCFNFSDDLQDTQTVSNYNGTREFKIPTFLVENMKQIEKENEGWKVRVYDLDDMRSFLMENRELLNELLFKNKRQKTEGSGSENDDEKFGGSLKFS